MSHRINDGDIFVTLEECRLDLDRIVQEASTLGDPEITTLQDAYRELQSKNQGSRGETAKARPDANPRLQQALWRELDRAVDSLYNMGETAEQFLHRNKQEGTAIPRLMDLSTVRAKVEKRIYTTPEDFRRDVDMIVWNCRQSSVPGSKIVEQALKLQNKAHELMGLAEESLTALREELQESDLDDDTEVPAFGFVGDKGPAVSTEQEQQAKQVEGSTLDKLDGETIGSHVKERDEKQHASSLYSRMSLLVELKTQHSLPFPEQKALQRSLQGMAAGLKSADVASEIAVSETQPGNAMSQHPAEESSEAMEGAMEATVNFTPDPVVPSFLFPHSMEFGTPPTYPSPPGSASGAVQTEIGAQQQLQGLCVAELHKAGFEGAKDSAVRLLTDAVASHIQCLAAQLRATSLGVPGLNTSRNSKATLSGLPSPGGINPQGTIALNPLGLGDVISLLLMSDTHLGSHGHLPLALSELQDLRDGVPVIGRFSPPQVGTAEAGEEGPPTPSGKRLKQDTPLQGEAGDSVLLQATTTLSPALSGPAGGSPTVTKAGRALPASPSGGKGKKGEGKKAGAAGPGGARLTPSRSRKGKNATAMSASGSQTATGLADAGAGEGADGVGSTATELVRAHSRDTLGSTVFPSGAPGFDPTGEGLPVFTSSLPSPRGQLPGTWGNLPLTGTASGERSSGALPMQGNEAAWDARSQPPLPGRPPHIPSAVPPSVLAQANMVSSPRSSLLRPPSLALDGAGPQAASSPVADMRPGGAPKLASPLQLPRSPSAQYPPSPRLHSSSPKQWSGSLQAHLQGQPKHMQKLTPLQLAGSAEAQRVVLRAQPEGGGTPTAQPDAQGRTGLSPMQSQPFKQHHAGVEGVTGQKQHSASEDHAQGAHGFVEEQEQPAALQQRLRQAQGVLDSLGTPQAALAHPMRRSLSGQYQPQQHQHLLPQIVRQLSQGHQPSIHAGQSPPNPQLQAAQFQQQQANQGQQAVLPRQGSHPELRRQTSMEQSPYSPRLQQAQQFQQQQQQLASQVQQGQQAHLQHNFSPGNPLQQYMQQHPHAHAHAQFQGQQHPYPTSHTGIQQPPLPPLTRQASREGAHPSSLQAQVTARAQVSPEMKPMEVQGAGSPSLGPRSPLASGTWHAVLQHGYGGGPMQYSRSNSQGTPGQQQG